MIKNSAYFDFNDLLVLFGEQNLFNIEQDFFVKGISIDSRRIYADNAFLAVKGERIDAHSKALSASDEGAKLLILNRDWCEKNENELSTLPHIRVKDTVDALGILGNHHRQRFDIPILAVAGSNGKTTTKDMIAEVLSQKFKTHKTYGNYNNLIGTPLVLLQLDETHQFAVIEIGTNQPGEIAQLSEMLMPTQGMITNIAEEHLEQLIDLDGVELEETYLFGYLRKHNGLAFLYMDDPRLGRYAGILEKKILYGSGENATIQIKINPADNLRYEINVEDGQTQFKTKTNAQGKTYALASVPAIAVGLRNGISSDQIKNAIENFQPDSHADYGRLLIENLSEISIINDSYNANPASMKMALETLQEFDNSGRKIAVLADMLELGNIAAEAHREILKIAAEKCDEILLFGDEMKKAAEKSGENIMHFDDFEQLISELNKTVKAGDCVLLKGSRGMKCERAAAFLKSKFGKEN